ncbi:MAG: sugar kinase [Acidobacteria bacterium]|nr:sugar kinase [Acidobacteriota bacterium]
MSTDVGKLLELVEAFPRQTILVLGDLVADEFVFGEISRVSREAPVLILRHRHTELLPGGGANAVNNLADLGARVLPVGAVGDDASGRALIDYFSRKKVDTSGILRVRGWTTTTKTRYLAGWSHTTRQQVLRMDREPSAPLSATSRKAIKKKAQLRLKKASAMLVSDYGCGAVSVALVRSLRAKLVTLDSRFDLMGYRDAGISAATPNEPELEAIHNMKIGADRARLESLGVKTLQRMGLSSLIVTRGKDGMAVFERGQKPQHVPIYGGDQVADVTGAGDTVIAVVTLALAAGGNIQDAAQLATYAGGIVVMKRGTATVTRNELVEAIRGDAGVSR